MNRSYWDTSAVIKLFRKESGSLFLREKLTSAKGAVILSNLALLEFNSAIHKQFRKGLIDAKELNLFQIVLAKHIREKNITVLKIKSQHFNVAEVLVNQLGRKRECQTFDALHLAMGIELFQANNLTEFVAADRVLLSLARDYGLPTLDPETV
jgi:uncharacterized protein with PIN domain